MRVFINFFIKTIAFLAATSLFFLILGIFITFSFSNMENANNKKFSFKEGDNNSLNKIFLIELKGPILNKPTDILEYSLINSIDAIYVNRKPIIWTLHDYKLLCPDSHFLSHGKICQKCLGGKFYMCTLNKCKKDSYTASLMASLEAYFHKTLNMYEKVNYFIAPSEFLKEKFFLNSFSPL